MSIFDNPPWWRREFDTAWDRVKDVFRREWDETHPDPDNEITAQPDEDVAANALREDPYEEIESAYRFGFGAHRFYGDDYPAWDDALEALLMEEWSGLHPDDDDAWDRDADAIRRGWECQVPASFKK